MIKVQNIYYMLAYAFKNLSIKEEIKYDSEEFEFVEDLFAAILANGIAKQLKQGLRREYIMTTEEIYSPKGKICLAETIKYQSEGDRLTVCQIDDYIENTYMNQILKATVNLLLRSNDVKEKNKRKLKRIILYFSAVDQISFNNIQWSSLKYDRNSKSYKMLMNICYLVIEGMLISDKAGNYRLNKFIDDRRMCTLYENFIFAYYQRHYPTVKVKHHSSFNWKTDEDIDTYLLPRLIPDVTLKCKGFILIIDAKYYTSALQVGQYGKKTVHSHNLYQIFTYVKNKDKTGDGSVSGMILYANTDGDNPKVDCHMGGNKISVRTLDLNCSFKDVQEQLDGIMQTWCEENNLEYKKFE